MIEHKTIVDSEGNIVSLCEQVENDKVITFELLEGYQVVEYFNKKQIVNNREELLLKPQWNGTEWVETATQEELNVAYPVIVTEPTELDKLRSDVDYIMIMQGL